jgi:hypothetical protein
VYSYKNKNELNLCPLCFCEINLCPLCFCELNLCPLCICVYSYKNKNEINLCPQRTSKGSKWLRTSKGSKWLRTSPGGGHGQLKQKWQRTSKGYDIKASKQMFQKSYKISHFVKEQRVDGSCFGSKLKLRCTLMGGESCYQNNIPSK